MAAPGKRHMPRACWWARNAQTSGDTASHIYHKKKPLTNKNLNQKTLNQKNENLHVHFMRDTQSDCS